MPLESVQELNARLTASWKTAQAAEAAAGSVVEPSKTPDEEPTAVAAPVSTPEPEAVTEPEQASPAPAPQPTSSIAAWTSGWDTEPASDEPPFADESPNPEGPAAVGRAGSRFEMLQAQARQITETATNPDMPQDFTPRVTDPGWGAPSSAPDWAQPESAAVAQAQQPAASTTAPAAPAPPEAERASTGTAAEPPQQPGGDGKMSMYQRLSNSPEAKAGRAQAPSAPAAYVEDIPSADDVTIEESGLVGRAAVERILGGRFVEERPLNGRQ